MFPGYYKHSLGDNIIMNSEKCSLRSRRIKGRGVGEKEENSGKKNEGVRNVLEISSPPPPHALYTPATQAKRSADCSTYDTNAVNRVRENCDPNLLKHRRK